MSSKEIERKFLIKELPADLDKHRCHEIEQAYLCREPVIRIRRSDEDYYMTYKGKGLLEREEYNLPLNEKAYEQLLKKTEGSVIKKRRYVIPIDDPKEYIKGISVPEELTLCIELDIFSQPEEMILAEVEFPSLEIANHFIMPSWFKEDVTGQLKYYNSHM